MRINQKTDYCLKTILDLSKHYSTGLVRNEDLSKRQGIPRKFLEQILIQLKKGGYLESKRGPQGGYNLVRHPSQISLGEVVRYVGGSLYPTACSDPLKNKKCETQSTCVFAHIWHSIGDEITQKLDKLTFENLMEQESKLVAETTLDYQI